MLQLFAEETVDHTAEPDAVKDSVNPENTSDDSGEEKKYTDKDVDAIVNKRFAKWKTEQEQAVKSAKEEAEKLIRITEESFFKGIEKAYVDNRLTDISNEIQQYVEANGFSVVRDFVGHGIGRKVHEDPEVPNFGRPGRGPKLMAGMVLAIEPMVNMGSYRVKTLDDGWTVVTADGKLSAHYENTVAILPNGPEILTLIK